MIQIMTEKGDKKIKEIVDGAIEEFIEKGYDETSMEGIAKRANLSKGGLYHHFSSKMEILYMVNMRFLEPIQDYISEIEQSKSVVEGLRNFVNNYLRYWDGHRKELNLYFLIMNASFSDVEIMLLLKSSSNQFFGYFCDLFKRGYNEGIFKETDFHSHAVAFISCLDGYLGYLMMEPVVTLDQMISSIQNIFINNILK